MRSVLLFFALFLVGCAGPAGNPTQSPCQITDKNLVWRLVGNEVEFVNIYHSSVRVKTSRMGTWCEVPPEGIVRLPVNLTINRSEEVVVLYRQRDGSQRSWRYQVYDSEYNVSIVFPQYWY